MNSGMWINKKTKNIRSGQWCYVWHSDIFYIWIKGLPMKSIKGDHPEFGNWKLIGK